MPRILLIAAYFLSTLVILAIAAMVYVQERTGGFIGALLIALLRTGEFYYATEGMVRLPSSGGRKAVVGVVAAGVDAIVTAVGLAAIELTRSAALAQGASRRGTDLAAIIAACVVVLVLVSPRLIPALRQHPPQM